MTNYREIEAYVDRLEEDIDRLEEDLLGLDEEAEDFEAARESIEEEIKELRAEYDHYEGILYDADIEALNRQYYADCM